MERLRHQLKQRREEEKAEKERGEDGQSDEKEKVGKKWGYDLYPERRGQFKSSVLKTLTTLEGRETTDRLSCEMNVYDCVMKSPLVKIMMGALKASGW